MAEGGNVEWELSKENIQPLRRGRAISALQQALSQQQDGAISAINQQKQAFECELRMYDGDDPLDVWDRYIKWTEQTFPQGGKESNLTTLLERVVTRFTEEKKYHNDPRYVELWIKFAENCPEPLDIYRYMQAQGIGLTQTSLYIAWSEEYENQGNFLKADLVYQEGFKKCAEPHDKLLHFHKALQARVSRQVMMNVEDDGSDDEPKQAERVSLADLRHKGKKKAIAPVNRTGSAIRSISGGLKSHGGTVLGNVLNSQLVIFDENKTESAGPSEPKLESWAAPPTSRAKENEQKPEKWCNVKLPQKTKFGHTVMAPPPPKPTFQPFVEESDQLPTMTPCKINPAVNTILSARKPSREETPLKRLQDHQQQKEAEEGKLQEQSMYCKELLFNGATEFCFEELRAESYFKKMAQDSQEAREVDQVTVNVAN
ncbi:mitotic checkpoint serine/threonine-protein kinase BUB1 beta [Melanotaenia boesemani]|uniref:mitotic checkpoint serine/threonine-protein kinase BUB1 beta n=1 Tax=Melanotaenia boesemani TaxID=1250792 RepID=UPI001C04AFE9|nr:mitotic checkpoint serine/threonine-protein kinase BUB1 beta [Melanotaenia boesemani]XP_041827040.1 mitotic checkpoint serine/threonine-protein kinase BUB1 beta [Melanotaenia boesemani]XP_041827041.1 mitotic checkpoint serine/threonine-protein kinase BUB1 beta [Melanotaenia boesemani]